jgi:DNA-binding MltR family transcriptional regulator
MAKQRNTTKRLKELSRAVPSETSTRAVMLALESQQHAFGDYSIAIIGSGLVEKALEAVILTRFIKPDQHTCVFDYDRNGPLSDLAAKIKIAHALGLFGPNTRDDLEHIRTIRNAFAHSLNLLRFETKQVADVCGLLHIPSTIKFQDRLLLAVGNTDSPRGRYIVTTLALAGRLRGTLATAKSVSLTSRGAEIIGNLGLP